MIGFVVTGFIIGALAQLGRRGKQQLGVPATFGLGAVGSCSGRTTASRHLCDKPVTFVVGPIGR